MFLEIPFIYSVRLLLCFHLPRFWVVHAQKVFEWRLLLGNECAILLLVTGLWAFPYGKLFNLHFLFLFTHCCHSWTYQLPSFASWTDAAFPIVDTSQWASCGILNTLFTIFSFISRNWHLDFHSHIPIWFPPKAALLVMCSLIMRLSHWPSSFC